MARKSSVLEFRRPKPRKLVTPGPVRTNKLKFSRRSGSGVRTLLAGLIFMPAIFLAGLMAAERLAGDHGAALASTVTSRTAAQSLRVVWADGDSGEINGRRFRLYGVDAPEGSLSRARCDDERRKAAEARKAVRELTMGGRVTLRESHGVDRYGRELLSLSVDGSDLASTLVASRHAQRWDYEAGDPKPDWCA